MRSRFPFLIVGALMVALASWSCAQSRTQAVQTATTAPLALTAAHQKVVDHMLANWAKQMNVTTVSLAMQTLGGSYTSEDRVRVGLHLKNHPELHRTLRTFGWETFALEPREKRIALVLSRAERERRQGPSIGELAAALEETPEAVASSMQMLERFGIVRRDPAAGAAGYRMADERYVDWEGAMRITFMDHRVHVEGLEPFNVN